MPGIHSPLWNFVTEAIGTFVLLFVLLSFGKTPTEVGPLAVALLVVAIGATPRRTHRLRHQPGA